MSEEAFALPKPPAAPLVVVKPARKWWNSTLLPFLGVTIVVNLLCSFALGTKLSATNAGLRDLLLAQSKETADLKASQAVDRAAVLATAEANRVAVEKAVQANQDAVKASVVEVAANQETIRQTVARDANETQRKRDVALATVVDKVTELAQGVELSLANSSQVAATSKEAAEIAAQAARQAAYASSHTAAVVQSKVATTADKKSLERQQAKAAKLNATLQTRVQQYKTARRKLEDQTR